MGQIGRVERYLCLSVDVQGYGAHSDVRQAEIQAVLIQLLDTAGDRAGLVRTSWIRQPKGDEELALIPSSEPQQRVVGDFCLALEAQLNELNGGRAPADRVRLRLAMDEGPVELAPNGFAGRAVVGVSRLVNSRPVRQALTLAQEANLAVIVSRGVFQDWVSSGRSGLAPGVFRCLPVAEKEYVEDAWVWVPAADVHALALDVAVGPTGLAAAGLPWPGAHFLGRDRELSAVVGAVRFALRARTPAICTITGMAGTGKTTLAIQAAREVAPEFPDGCVFVDLHGYTPDSVPDPPEEVLDRLLRRLGVALDDFPSHVDDRAALFREKLHGHRMLFVLDNAHDVAQVRRLLPAVPGCGALITSRARLTALDEATPVSLDVMPVAAAAALFRAIAGDAAELDAGLVLRVVRGCGQLPLAIRIAAARYKNGPGDDLGDLAERLADESGRLAELDDGDRSVAASLAVSYAGLSPPQQRLLGLLGAHPTTEFELPAVAALAGTAPPEAKRLLHSLVDRYLVHQPASGRFGLHDLVHTFARGDALPRQPAEIQALAVGRMVDFYLTTAAEAHLVITPHQYRIDIHIEHRPMAVPDVARYDDAVDWLARHERTLIELCRVAAEHGLDAQCWQLSHVLRGYVFLTRRWAPWSSTHGTALAATRRLHDGRAEALTLSNVGLALLEQGEPALAAGHYREALRLFEAAGDERGAQTARTNLGWTEFSQGRFDPFVRELQNVLAYYRGKGLLHNAAIVLRGLALGELKIGSVDAAVKHLHEALAYFEAAGQELDQAMTLNALGEAHARSGHAAAAARSCERAAQLSARCGSVFEQARAHRLLADLARAGGELDRLRHHLTLALGGYRALGSPVAKELQAQLDELEAA